MQSWLSSLLASAVGGAGFEPAHCIRYPAVSARLDYPPLQHRLHFRRCQTDCPEAPVPSHLWEEVRTSAPVMRGSHRNRTDDLSLFRRPLYASELESRARACRMIPGQGYDRLPASNTETFQTGAFSQKDLRQVSSLTRYPSLSSWLWLDLNRQPTPYEGAALTD